jgi:peroxiredoxin
MKLGLALCLSAAFLASPAPAAPADLLGRPAPAMEGFDLQQRPISLSGLRGRLVLVTFWAVWCKPCREEMPLIAAAYGRHRDDGFEIVAVNLGDGRKEVKRFADELGLTFPIIVDVDRDIAARFGVIGLPTNFIIDVDGVIRQVFVGERLGAERLETLIDSIVD